MYVDIFQEHILQARPACHQYVYDTQPWRS